MVQVDKIAKIATVTNPDIVEVLSFEKTNEHWQIWLGQNMIQIKDRELGELIDAVQKLRTKG